MTNLMILSEECETIDEMLEVIEATLRTLSDMAEDAGNEKVALALEEARQKVESVEKWPC